MKNFDSRFDFAHNLMPDDWFRMGGFSYRIAKTSFNAMDGIMTITCYPVHTPKKLIVIQFPKDTFMKIYNQK